VKIIRSFLGWAGLGWAGLALTLTFILFCKPKKYIVRRYGKKV
jgi:hypothetical protein